MVFFIPERNVENFSKLARSNTIFHVEINSLLSGWRCYTVLRQSKHEKCNIKAPSQFGAIILNFSCFDCLKTGCILIISVKRWSPHEKWNTMAPRQFGKKFNEELWDSYLSPNDFFVVKIDFACWTGHDSFFMSCQTGKICFHKNKKLNCDSKIVFV